VSSILITGGSGFLGSGLVEKLLRSPEYNRICIYSRSEHRQAEMREEFGNDARLRWLIGDVRDERRLERALHGVEDVIHAAALKRVETGEYDPVEMFKTNLWGTESILAAAERAYVRRIVLVSSDKAYQPVSPYGLSKAGAEALFRRHHGNLATAVVRYGNVAGSTGSVIPRWRAAKDRIVDITDPDCTRFWMWREQAVDFVLSGLLAAPCKNVMIPDLPAFRIGDLAEAMGLYARVIGLPDHEKKHESMDATHCSETARRLTVEELRRMLPHV